ncbi:MAG: hypothetical protein JNK87_17700 [Bryobacterales bacterium]|nr:hypothetical protein [Bryobacterales bacterium]
MSTASIADPASAGGTRFAMAAQDKSHAWPLLRLAWRDLRQARSRPLLLLAAFTLAIASFTGIRAAQQQAEAALSADLRRWLGADIAASTGDPIDQEARAALDTLRPSADWTIVSFTMVMIRSGNSPDIRPAGLKIVDPASYPLYPGLVLDPPSKLEHILQPGHIAVSREVLAEMRVEPGDKLTVAGKPFTIAAVLAAEADRFQGFPGVPLRLMLSRQAYQGAGLARPGNASKNFALLRLKSGAIMDQTRTALRQILPAAALSDYRNASPTAVNVIQGSIAFLGVTAVLMLAVSLAALLAALRQHVHEQMPLIATCKMLGARPSQIAVIFTTQLAALLAASCLFGLPLGLLVRSAVLAMFADPLPPAPLHPAKLAAETLLLIIAAVAIALPYAISLIRTVRPSDVLRATAPGSTLPAYPRWQTTTAAAAILCLLAVRLAGSFTAGLLLLVSLLLCVLLTVLLSGASLSLLARLHRATPFVILRQAMANLSRATLRSRTLLVALSFGLLLADTTFLLHRAVARTIVNGLPFPDANLFVAGFEPPLRESILQALAAQPGIAGPPDLVTQARLRLTEAKGTPVNGGWREAGCLPHPPPPRNGAIAAAVHTDTARELRLNPGDPLLFTGAHGSVPAYVAAVVNRTRVERFRYTSLTLDCRGLPESSLFHMAAIRIPPSQQATAQRSLAAQFPMTAVFTADDLSESVFRVSRDALSLTRLLAGYAILASLCVLAAIVTSLRHERLRELAILAALGASPRTRCSLLTIEFATTGILAAMIAAILTAGLLSLTLSVVLRSPMLLLPSPAALLLSAPLAAALSTIAGWLPLLSSLRQRPLELLRTL